MTASAKVAGLEVLGFSDMDAAVAAVVGDDGQVRPGVAVAINPEKVMAYRRDASLRELFERATFRYPDGIGVVAALRRKGVPTIRIPGCELWERLVGAAADASLGVFMIGAKPGVLDRVTDKLRNENPGFEPVGLQHGYFDESAEDDLIDRIAESGARFVSVGMGSPKQELFMLRAAVRVPEAFFMGVGGTYDVYIGETRRAPRMFRGNGLEWLYRLLAQPSRYRRQFVLLKYTALLATGRL